MSRGQTLRALVNERLAAAAEDIFVLFERTISEYEEELCRIKRDNQRNAQITQTSPGSGLNQEITETPQIKEEPEEQIVKQEEEQMPVSVPESIAVCVKTEESPLLPQRQTEHQEKMQGEDISSEPHFRAFVLMDTEADGDRYNQVLTTDRSPNLFPQNQSGPETTVYSEHMSGAQVGAVERKKHPCPFCEKIFEKKQKLHLHIRVHTGERPYSCSMCDKTFAHKGNLNSHKKTHTGEKPYSCSICEKTFAHKSSLDSHTRTHTGEKPYSCSSCEKQFADPSALRRHRRTHTDERPYSCSICERAFAQKSVRDSHERTHRRGTLEQTSAFSGDPFFPPL